MRSVLYLFLLFFFLHYSCNTPATRTATNSNETILQSRLDSILNVVMRTYKLPGLAIGVIKGNKIIYAKGFGLRKSGTSDSITTKSLFHMASVSKPFVATAILQLAEKGKLSIDSPLIRYIPYFNMKDPDSKKITIKQMLTHTSGFPDVKDYSWGKPQYDEKARERYIKDSMPNYSLLFKPGTGFTYSNMSYDVLAEVVTLVSGLTFEAYMKKYVFEPCQMDNTTFLRKEVPDALATSPHVLGNSGYFEVSSIYPYNRRHAGSSTLHSNIEDMLKWESRMLNNGTGILSSASFNSMHAPEYKFDDSSSHGLGFFIDSWNGKKLINHAGGDVGYSSYVGLILEDSVAILFMSNISAFAPYDVLKKILLNTIYNLPVPALKEPVSLVIAPIIFEKGFAAAREKYIELKKDSLDKYDFNDSWLNTLGWALVDAGNLAEAIHVLQLNAESNPTIAYCFENLGEVYLLNGQKKEAAANYKQALKLDPHCENCRSKLKEITK